METDGEMQTETQRKWEEHERDVEAKAEEREEKTEMWGRDGESNRRRKEDKERGRG